MIDLGSMTCTLSKQVEQQMLVNKLLPAETAMKEEVVLVVLKNSLLQAQN